MNHTMSHKTCYRQPRHRSRGITIIEVMIVIAVIAVVVAISMPAHIRSRHIAHARQCQENMALIDGALKAASQQKSMPDTAAVTLDDLIETTGTGFLQEIPRCPIGGTYAVTTIDQHPTCSIGHNENAPHAPHTFTTPVPQP